MKYRVLVFVIMLFASQAVKSESLVAVTFHEIKITTRGTIKLGFTPEFRERERNDGLNEFRVTVPNNIDGRQIEFATGHLFTDNDEMIATLQLTVYRNEKNRKYFAAYLNREVVRKIVLTVFCSESYIYEFPVDLQAL